MPATPHQILRKFGLSVGTVVLIIAALLLRKGNTASAVAWISLGSMLAGAGLLRPQSLNRVYFIWMKFAAGLGYVNTRILLGILFYAVLTPLGLALKLLRIDILDKTPDRKQASYWKPLNHKPTTESYRNPF